VVGFDTWYLGLPASSSHTLIGSIVGVGLMNSIMSPDNASGANGSGIQKDTVRNIILAWVLTLPVCVALGATLFAMGLFFVLRVLGVR